METPEKVDIAALTENFRDSVIKWISSHVKERPGFRYGFITAIPVPPTDDEIVTEVAESIWFDDITDSLMIVTRDLRDNSHRSDPANLFSADLLIAVSDKFKRND